MHRVAETKPVPTVSLWAGRITMGLTVLFLLSDSVMKMMNLAVVRESHAHLGVPDSLNPVIGVILFVCIAIYLIPRTATLGAILLTGYLGGATAILLRVGDPFAFPAIVAVLVWVGRFLVDYRLRSLLMQHR